MLVYSLHPGGEMVTDSTQFQIEKCFKHQVNLNFSKEKSLPGSNVNLQVSAASNSLCALWAVDQSVLLLRSYGQLSAQSVYSQLYSRELHGYYFRGLNLEDGLKVPCLKDEHILYNGIYYTPAWADFGKDAYDLVKTTFIFASLMEINMSPRLKTKSVSKILQSLCSSGAANLRLTVPDTITQWKASGFCMNDKAGFGLSPTVSMTAFQPFFVDLTLPYSVVRGEAFTLKANVFNYLKSCIQVNTVLKASSVYQARLLSTEYENICICGNEKKSFTWLVTPQTLGSTVSQPVVLTLPDNLVKDSPRAYWSVLGDILGSAMQNLQNLLHLPFGCGEQNMALFTPNIYILDYLSQTQQLTEEIKSKIIGYLTTGYQRQLSYKHFDGSYSTFGHKDEHGHTWLTAFVYKSFAQAKRYIYIDDKVQSQTLIWLLNIQKPDGCFLNFGKAFNNALKGKEDNEISLTAYVIGALLEADHPVSFMAIQKGLQCLETVSRERAMTTYEQALLAYTYSLVGYEDKREFFFNELNKKAKRVGGSVYWELEERFSMEGLSSLYYPQASSADIEMTCYGLLALLFKPQLTSEELSYASQIVHWVAKQQNSHGGFFSTKDTIVALQALTLFQRLTFSKNRQNSVQIFSDQGFNTAFQVNDKNRLLLQQIPLPTTKGKYMVEVNGNGCVYVQSTLRYNILLPKKSSGFSLSVNTANAFCRGLFDAKFDLVVSASYYGKRNSSNMAIIDVKMLSGFVPDRSSVKKLQEDGKVQRVEIKTTHVFFYLENVTQKEIQFSFSIKQDALVSNIKPASVQLYDYYETGHRLSEEPFLRRQAWVHSRGLYCLGSHSAIHISKDGLQGDGHVVEACGRVAGVSRGRSSGFLFPFPVQS
ncbi:PREDICTED: ovostatin-like [Mandrillus leucophaeus]|uniref:ovostatin-like n=1 Tax=Mandrillus leucophaeus TaxID=9568 RepID=UPI0005F4A655|nr:PREDICTED: ovostatin-like [Mandrillus leucophaeus]